MAKCVAQIEGGTHTALPLICADHLGLIDAGPLDGVCHRLHAHRSKLNGDLMQQGSMMQQVPCYSNTDVSCC